MSYRVLFHPLVDSALIDLWLNSARRADVTDAVNRLEKDLAIRPHDLGESREGEERIAFQGPIGIEFRIDHMVGEVLVFNIWEIPRRKGPSRDNA